jgi:hypothetical protein
MYDDSYNVKLVFYSIKLVSLRFLAVGFGGQTITHTHTARANISVSDPHSPYPLERQQSVSKAI